MPRLPKAREIIQIAHKLGFVFIRQKGSHAIYRHDDGTRITVPIHGSKEISPAVFHRILGDLKMTSREFWKF